MDMLKTGRKLHKAFLLNWSNTVLKPLFSELKCMGFTCIDSPIVPRLVKNEPEVVVVFKNKDQTKTIIICARFKGGYNLVIQTPTLSFRYPSEEEGIVSNSGDIIDIVKFHLHS